MGFHPCSTPKNGVFLKIPFSFHVPPHKNGIFLKIPFSFHVPPPKMLVCFFFFSNPVFIPRSTPKNVSHSRSQCQDRSAHRDLPSRGHQPSHHTARTGTSIVLPFQAGIMGKGGCKGQDLPRIRPGIGIWVVGRPKPSTLSPPRPPSGPPKPSLGWGPQPGLGGSNYITNKGRLKLRINQTAENKTFLSGTSNKRNENNKAGWVMKSQGCE